MSPLTILHGDCRETLRTLPDESVHCCVTSPPYFGLRDYGHAGQIGLEETPEAYVAELVAVFREVRRVLREGGTLWLNLGDSYNAAGRTGHGTREGFKQGTNRASAGCADACRPSVDGLKPKDLIGIPWRVAFALQADGWFLRQDIIWHKPNPMPESVRDRCTKAHEYLFLLAKSERYYFDHEAMQEESVSQRGAGATGRGKNPSALAVGCNGRQPQQDHSGWLGGAEGKRNRRSVWSVTTKPYKGAHFATYPPELIRPCVLAGCPIGGTVLDPFGGSGTTGQVALEELRRAVLCEANGEYVELIHQRCAPALEIAKIAIS